MGRKAPIAVLWLISAWTVTGLAVKDNVSAESARLYRNVPHQGVYASAYASAAPYGAFSFHVPAAVPSAKASQLIPVKQESIVIQNSNGYLKDSYGNKFVETPQSVAYKTTFPQQFVQLQHLPAHLSQPLAATPSYHFPQGPPQAFFGAQYRFPSLDAVTSPLTRYGAFAQPFVYGSSVKSLTPASDQQFQFVTPSKAQQDSSNNKAVYAQAYNQLQNEPKFQRLEEKPQQSESYEAPRQQAAPSLKAKVQTPVKHTVKTTHNGQDTVVHIETKPPLPLLDLSLLEPLTFTNPIVPQVQHYLPKINPLTYSALHPQDDVEVKNHKEFVVQKTKSYDSGVIKGKAHSDEPKKKQKKPPRKDADVYINFESKSEKPSIKVKGKPNDPGYSYEINSPGYKESYNQQVVSYNKQTQNEPITYTYEKQTQKEPVTYSYSHSSKDPGQTKTVQYVKKDPVPNNLVYTFQAEQEPEHRESPQAAPEESDDSNESSEAEDEGPSYEHSQYDTQPHHDKPSQSHSSSHSHSSTPPSHSQQYVNSHTHNSHPSTHSHQSSHPHLSSTSHPSTHSHQSSHPHLSSTSHPSTHSHQSSHPHLSSTSHPSTHSHQSSHPHLSSTSHPSTHSHQSSHPHLSSTSHPSTHSHQSSHPHLSSTSHPSTHSHQSSHPHLSSTSHPSTHSHQSSHPHLSSTSHPSTHSHQSSHPHQSSTSTSHPSTHSYQSQPQHLKVEQVNHNPTPSYYVVSHKPQYYTHPALTAGPKFASLQEYMENLRFLPSYPSPLTNAAIRVDPKQLQNQQQKPPQYYIQQTTPRARSEGVVVSEPVIYEKSKKIIIQEESPDEVHSQREQEKLSAEMVGQEENSEEDFEKSYKEAAYGFPAYDRDSSDSAEEIYNHNYGEPHAHSDDESGHGYLPFEQYQEEGDEFPKSARLSYKDDRDKMQEDYYLGYSLNKPEVMTDRYQSKINYYKMFMKNKPEKLRVSDGKKKSAKYTVEPSFFNSAPRQKSKQSAQYKSAPTYEYNYDKESRDNSAHASRPLRYRSKTHFVEPQFQYGFEPIAIPRLDSELDTMASNHRPESEKPGTRKKVYKENWYIKKTSTSSKPS